MGLEGEEMKLRTGLVKVLIGLFALVIPAAALAGDVKIEKDIVYSTVGKFELKGDILVPEGKGPFAGLMYIHGGGFVAGNKDMKAQANLAQYLAKSGFLVFAVNYRLIQEGGVLPNSTYDVKNALCWFRKNGTRYGLDPKRVGVLGESAGGYLAAMLDVTGGLPEYAPTDPALKGCDDTVTATVAVFPPTDFTTFDNNLSRMVKNEMLRASKIKVSDKETIKKFMYAQSPVNYAKNAQPILLIHGENDMLVPVGQSREFNKALKEAGRDVEYLELKDAQHGFFSERDNDVAQGARGRAVEFLKKKLAPAK
jgi:acetyl esterase/lipase